jgi:hypothetical protein
MMSKQERAHAIRKALLARWPAYKVTVQHSVGWQNVHVCLKPPRGDSLTDAELLDLPNAHTVEEVIRESVDLEDHLISSVVWD